MKHFCLLMGKFPQFLDHLAPFAIELKIPLVIVEPEIYELGKKYYPNLDAVLASDIHLMTHYIPESETIFSCITHKIIKGAFSFIKDFNHYFIPHGMSEKGTFIKDYFAHFKDEKNILVYGDQLKEMINKDAFLPDDSFTQIKNYRYYHYLKNQKFYDQHLQELGLDTGEPFIFYAPTWNDNAKGSSVLSCKEILTSLSKKSKVVCKWHPHLFWQEPKFLDQIEKEHPEVIFLREFPLIYPLINACSIYIGDLSSIGYDCLAFEKPMIFLNEIDKTSKLFSCGEVLCKSEYSNIGSFINKALTNHQNRIHSITSLYEHAFTPKESIESFTDFFSGLNNAQLFPNKIS